MQVSYEPWLVLLSVVLAIAGAYIGLHLTVQIGTAPDPRRRLLLAGAAFSLGVAMWTVHFVGVLAARTPFDVDYLVLPTFLSFALCVLVAGCTVYVITSGPFSSARLALSSCLLAAAFGVLHYTGVAATSAHIISTPVYAAASLVIAGAGGALAFRLALGGRTPLVIAASVLGPALAAAHYIAEAGTMLLPVASAPGPAVSPAVLAIVIAVVAFGLSCLFLLLLVPEGAPAEARSLGAEFGARAENRSEAIPVALSSAGGDADLRRGIYAPLGGIGAPPPRIADNLPIERDGATHFVPVDEVVAVQANAHYTFLYDGKTKLFCPLSIGEVESRLDRGRFMRVHRSHIVNIERVTGYKRSGDSETVELAGAERYTVPVSRSRAGRLKSRIGAKNGGTGELPLGPA
jgi:NO-binding membrane sensor protein with MHYT domain